jgi:hypothetical protein
MGGERENGRISSGPFFEMLAYKCSRFREGWPAKVPLKRTASGSNLTKQVEGEDRTNTGAGFETTLMGGHYENL